MAACLTCPPPPPSLPASSRTLPPSPAASASRPPPRPRSGGPGEAAELWERGMNVAGRHAAGGRGGGRRRSRRAPATAGAAHCWPDGGGTAAARGAEREQSPGRDLAEAEAGGRAGAGAAAGAGRRGGRAHTGYAGSASLFNGCTPSVESAEAPAHTVRRCLCAFVALPPLLPHLVLPDSELPRV
ncbi:uncharacterized protein GJ701_016918 [Geothlypis trichas]